MDPQYPDGYYWTHPTYGPKTQPSHRKVLIKDGKVQVVSGWLIESHPELEQFVFSQWDFFRVNTMVGPAQ